MIKILINRIRSYFIRRKKARDMWGWLARYDAASTRSWAILTNGEPSIERFNRWERNHGRLLRLIAAKRAGEGGRITKFVENEVDKTENIQ